MSELAASVRDALQRLEGDLRDCPTVSDHFWRRARELGGSNPENLFLNPLSTPVLLFPQWVERSFTPTPDIDFQREVSYAAINLLYYVRLLDDAMDGHCTSAELLPALTFLHSRFQGGFQSLFPSGHRFWSYFFEILDRSTEVTVADFSLTALSLDEFLRYAAQKSCCALIPIAAVVCRYQRYEDFDAWADLWNAFSAWNQMRDDLLDWSRDLEDGIATYLLSEAARRKNPEESIPGWMLREGFDWSRDQLDQFAQTAAALARKRGVPEMNRDLNARYAKIAARV